MSMQSDALKIQRFDALNKDWLEFIKENRVKGGIQHDNDIVIGPVADDNTMETIQLYITNILSADEAVERLKYNKVNKGFVEIIEQFYNSKTYETQQRIKEQFIKWKKQPARPSNKS